MELNRLWKKVPLDLLNFLVRRDSVRRILLKKGEEKLYADFVRKNADNRPPRVQEGRYHMLRNLLHAVNRAISDGRVSSSVSRAILGNFVGKILLNEEDRSGHFHRRFGLWPPAFLTISPGKKCNLLCTGCYASSSAGNAEKLDYKTFNRILAEQRSLWGSYFTVISGGEPLLYKDGNKTLLDIVRENREQYFMMYTNGTLITKDTARRMADLGNITPAISVEGFERETDERRGKGVYRTILRSMENLKNAGVPFGISATATRKNVGSIMSDEFTELYFRRIGAVYGWIFQYMPIGRSFTIDLMITPEQRLALFQKEEEMIKKSNIFLVDFWNGGPYSVGCISAGRPGGYFYIDWNGNIAPCTFYPYYLSNVNDLYRENRTLNDVLFSPYFASIRSWQNEYGYTQPPGKVDNLIVPCIMRDHFPAALDRVKRYGAKPMDENAAAALKDAGYRRRMTEYGKTTKALTQKHWEAEFK
jgi:MoaA/NifB/PqqE/SkfB family radical SAM enzyme